MSNMEILLNIKDFLFHVSRCVIKFHSTEKPSSEVKLEEREEINYFISEGKKVYFLQKAILSSPEIKIIHFVKGSIIVTVHIIIYCYTSLET